MTVVVEEAEMEEWWRGSWSGGGDRGLVEGMVEWGRTHHPYTTQHHQYKQHYDIITGKDADLS